MRSVKQYRAVLFDLFGTVALFNREQLPLFEWNGQTSRSTMGELQAVYTQKVPAVPFERFFTALTDVSRELGEVRTREMREFPSAHRFTLTLLRAGLDDSAETHRLAEELSLAHMTLLAGATEVPAAHARLLAHVRARYDVALVSNFDHASTARYILGRDGVDTHFHHIVISDEHGWRKPHPRIFTDALTALGAEPGEALFVGDSPHDDIVGARGVGMDIAWVNALDTALPDGIPAPDYTVRAIPELQSILV
jgi:putative hydrolase of the HAD superfamily